MKIKSDGNQLFSVPNDTQGKTFLKLCQKYLNTSHFELRKIKRGPRKKTIYGTTWEPKWFAVYLYPRKQKWSKHTSLEGSGTLDQMKLFAINRP